MKRYKTKNKKANALIVTVSVMMVLSVMGITFVRIATIDHTASGNSQNTITARMLALAGIDYATLQLRSDFSEKVIGVNKDWVFYKEDSDATDTPNSSQFAEDHIGTSIPLKDAHDLSTAYPSYSMEVGGRKVSGYLKDDFHNYTLKIFDTTSQINLNSQDIDSSVTITSSHPMAKVLRNLSEAIALREPYVSLDTADKHTNGPLKGLEVAILEKRRNMGGFKSKFDLVGIKSGSTELTHEDLKYVWDYLTVYPHLNILKTVDAYKNIKPNTGNETYLRDYRSPVNINTASWPVLVAVMRSLSNGTIAISETDARKLANRICIRRNIEEFTSWDDFYSFVESQKSTETGKTYTTGALQGDSDADIKIAIIKANFDPNVSLRKCNPDAPLYQDVNKTDLSHYSTEFCFFPHGVFEVTSLGEIFTKKGQVISSCKLYTILNTFNLKYQSTQQDFEKNSRYTTLTNRDIFTNIGPDESSCGPSDKIGLHGFSFPNNLQKDYSPWSGIETDSNQYFGSIQPVVMDLKVTNVTGANLANTANYLFQANFNGKLEADIGSDTALKSSAIPNKTANLVSGLSSDGLMADGVVFKGNSETQTLCYSSGGQAGGNFPPLAYDSPSNNKGTLMFWMKPNKNSDGTWKKTIYVSNVDNSNSYLGGIIKLVHGIQMIVDTKFSPSANTLEIQARRKYFHRVNIKFSFTIPIVGIEVNIDEHILIGPDLSFDLSFPPLVDETIAFPPGSTPSYSYHDYGKRIVLSPSNNAGVHAQEWYHVAIRWKQGTDMDFGASDGFEDMPIVVSGTFYDTNDDAVVRGPLNDSSLIEDYQKSDGSLLADKATVSDLSDYNYMSGVPHPDNLCYIGCVQTGAAPFCTIDDVRVYNDCNLSDLQPSRFPIPSDPLYPSQSPTADKNLVFGIYKSSFSLGKAGEKNTLTYLNWTVRSWGDLAFGGGVKGNVYGYKKEVWDKLWKKMVEKEKLIFLDDKGKEKKREFKLDMLDANVSGVYVNVVGAGNTDTLSSTKEGKAKTDDNKKSIKMELSHDGTNYWIAKSNNKTRENVYSTPFSANSKPLYQILLEWHEHVYGADAINKIIKGKRMTGYPLVQDSGVPQVIQDAGTFNFDLEFPADNTVSQGIFRCSIIDDVTITYQNEKVEIFEYKELVY